MTMRTVQSRIKGYDYINRQRSFFNIQDTNPKLWLSSDKNVGTMGARVLDGVDQHFVMASFPQYGTGNATIEAWFNAIDAASSRTIFNTNASASGGGINIYQDTSSRLVLQVSDSDSNPFVITSGSYVVGKWHHVVWVVNRTLNVADAYVDGAWAATLDISTVTGSITPTGIYKTIGATSFPWKGSLSRARIAIGYAYTLADVLESYNQGNGKFYAELSSALASKITHAWNLNEAGNTNANDATANNNDGTQTGTSTNIAAGPGPREATAIDTIGGYHGTLTNMDNVNAWSTDVPNVPSCAGGYSLTFDGIDDFVNAGNNGANLQGVEQTFALWVKPTSLGNSMTFFGIDDWKRQSCIHFSSRKILSNISAATTNASVQTTNALTNNVWSHVVIRYSNSGAVGTARKIHVFLNGAECSYDTQVASEGVESTPNGPIRLGWRDGSTAGSQFQGKMDDVRIYNTALSDANIALLAAGNEPATAPIAHWKFNDGPQFGEPSDGDPICTWESKEGNRYQANQVTASLCPTYIRGAVNGQPAIDFDGVDDFLEFIDAIGISTGAGHCMIVSSQDANKLATIYSQSDEAVATRFFDLGAAASGFLSYNQNDAGTVDTLNGNTPLGTSYKLLEISSNGTLVAMKVNQAVQTITAASGANNGDWAGDVTGPDNSILGALKTTAVSKYFAGRIAEFIYWDAALSSNNANAVRVELANKYGIVLV